MIVHPVPRKSPLEQLVYLLRKGAEITKVSDTPIAGNGLPYCYVVVTETKGTQYFIHAYEKEATELHEMAVNIMKTK